MGPRAARALAALAAALAMATPVAAAPPARGLLVPGQSLGGIGIAMTKAQVRAGWGSAFGRCRSCRYETWYFNYRPFAPQGAGVSFLRSRVTRVFTIWQPPGWRTAKGLALGSVEAKVTQLYGTLTRIRCDRYDALVLPGVKARTVFYIQDGALWGFGLTRPESSPCF